jgi:hypothetical protein
MLQLDLLLRTAQVHASRAIQLPRWRHIAAMASNLASLQVQEHTPRLLLNQRILVLAAFGRKRALNGGMLRITLPTASQSGLFILEGRQTGLWVKEFLRVARRTNQGFDNIFDLQEVFYVDSEGEKTLQLLARRGARFITESAYGKDLCHRLKLERVETSHRDNNYGMRPDGSRNLRESRTAHAGRLDALNAAGANQHPRRCAG